MKKMMGLPIEDSCLLGVSTNLMRCDTTAEMLDS